MNTPNKKTKKKNVREEMPVKKKDFIGLVLFLCTHVKIFLFNV